MSLPCNSTRPEFIGFQQFPNTPRAVPLPTHRSLGVIAQHRSGAATPGRHQRTLRRLPPRRSGASRAHSPPPLRSPRPYSKTCSEVQILMAAAGAEPRSQPRSRPRRAPRSRSRSRPSAPPRLRTAGRSRRPPMAARGAVAVTQGRVSPECRAEGAGLRTPPRPLRMRAGRSPAVRGRRAGRGGRNAAGRALNAL